MTEAEYKSILREQITTGVSTAVGLAMGRNDITELLQICSLAGGLIAEHPQGDRSPVGFQMSMNEVDEHEEYEDE